MARATDTLGPKRVVQVALVLWLTTLGFFVAAESRSVFWAACVIAGLGLGTVQSASRAFMATLIPRGREDEFFGFYALCGKTSAPVGTAIFGLVSAATGSQRAAVACISLFFIAGFALLRRVAAGGPTLSRRAAP
jgi:UMF1 family MFS transporter